MKKLSLDEFGINTRRSVTRLLGQFQQFPHDVSVICLVAFLLCSPCTTRDVSETSRRLARKHLAAPFLESADEERRTRGV